MLGGENAQLHQGAQLVAAGEGGDGESRRQLVGPALLGPDIAGRVHEGFEPRRNAAHIGGRAHDDGVGGIERLPVELAHLLDVDQPRVATARAKSGGDDLGQPPGVAVPRSIGNGDIAHAQRAAARIMSAAFSAIMIVGALVLPEVISGITLASTTRNPARPRRRNCPSSGAASSVPMRTVPTGWKMVVPISPAARASSASVCAARPGFISSGAYFAIGACAMMLRACRIASTATRRSPSVLR